MPLVTYKLIDTARRGGIHIVYKTDHGIPGRDEPKLGGTRHSGRALMLIHFTLTTEEVHDLILGANYLERRLRNAASSVSGGEREFLIAQAGRLEAVAEILVDASDARLSEVMNEPNDSVARHPHQGN
ncbi:MAG: hypothetical protein JO015_15455 [Verrucomicrobia bacterium]|nr:hypothetical protein [Verrucomicrobiota bacterium]